MAKPEERFGITCPKTSKFYMCPGRPSRFLGCCAVNPCDTSDGNCPQESVEYTSFNMSTYADISAQACVDPDPGVAWFACAYSKPAFMGCCAENACSARGCPKDALRASKLSDSRRDAAAFLPELAASISSSSATSESTSSASPSSSASASAAAASTPGLSAGAAAGIGVGAGLVAIIAIAGLIIWLRRRFVVGRKNKNQQQNQQMSPPPPQWQDPSSKHASSVAAMYQTHQHSPNPHSAVSPGGSPVPTQGQSVSPYTTYQPSPPQQWNAYQAVPTHENSFQPHQQQQQYPQYSGGTAELSAAAAEDTVRKANAEKMAAKHGHGSAHYGAVELEDPGNYGK